MSFLNQHAARQCSPAAFERFKQVVVPGHPEGVSLLCGIKNDGGTAIQSVRFDSQRWSTSKAKAWLRDNGFTVSGFESATGSPESQSDGFDLEGVSQTSDGKQVKLRLDVVKTYEMKVFGWLYVCRDLTGKQVVDHSGEVVGINTLEKASYGYVATERKAGDMHRRNADSSVVEVGHLIECVVFTPEKRVAMATSLGLEGDTLHKVLPDAMWVGYQFTDKDAWGDVLSGQKPALSFGGRARRVPLNQQQEVSQ